MSTPKKAAVANFVLRKRRCVINPEENDALRRWDRITGVALVFVAFVTPYEVGFVSDPGDIEFLKSGADAAFWVNRCVDLLFVADMILQFFVMYPVKNQYGTVFIPDQGLIIKHYLRTWFIVDFLSVLPFDLAGVIMASNEVSRLKALRVVRLLRLLKLTRLVRGFRILQRWEVEMAISYRKITLYTLLILVCVMSHWISCILGMISSVQGDFCVLHAEYVNKPDCVITWMSEPTVELIVDGGVLTPARLYLMSLYNAATFVVHPHAYKPVNDGERILMICLIFWGGFLWTKVISRSTAITTSMDRHNIHYHQTMDDLNENAAEVRLSQPLRRRLRGFFMNTKDSSRRGTWSELTHRMSPSLRNEVAYETHKSWLRRVPYLVGMSKLFIMHLTAKLKSEHFGHNEHFGANFTLYVIVRGLATKNSNKGFCMLRAGSVWGEEHLLLNVWWLLNPNTVNAVSFMEVMTLGREDFRHICDEHPENEQRLFRFYRWYVLTRGIIYTARKLKAEQEGETAPKRPEDDEHDAHRRKAQAQLRKSMSHLDRSSLSNSAISVGNSPTRASEISPSHNGGPGPLLGAGPGAAVIPAPDSGLFIKSVTDKSSPSVQQAVDAAEARLRDHLDTRLDELKTLILGQFPLVSGAVAPLEQQRVQTRVKNGKVHEMGCVGCMRYDGEK
mmetsp:Transcript_33982/g.76116  ORF Transcript_33982/g.76116 Transcript_33982/m.76116 type:complete len:674 (+) Transcript_33982:31-2052(+)